MTLSTLAVNRIQSLSLYKLVSPSVVGAAGRIGFLFFLSVWSGQIWMMFQGYGKDSL